MKYLAASALLLIAASAHAKDGWENRPKVCGDNDVACQIWIEQATTNTGTSCCAFADAYVTDRGETINGQYYAIVTEDGYPDVPKGTRIAIPKDRYTDPVHNGGNPTQHSVTFMGAPYEGEDGKLQRNVYCYFSGTLSLDLRLTMRALG